MLQSIQAQDQRVAIVDLSRNFGKEIALTAGLDNAKGDAVVVIDADLQDPPELILELVKYWREGYDVAYAKRTRRDGESASKKATAYGFYRIIQSVSRIKIPEDTGDFSLAQPPGSRFAQATARAASLHEGPFCLDRLSAEGRSLPQRSPAFGRNQTKWNYWRLWNFALVGITSFTTAPLKVATYLGLLAAFGAFIIGMGLIIDTLIHGNPVAGYPSLMVTILFLGGVQLITLGIIGEYLGRMFDEAKGRPLYLLNQYKPAELWKNSRFSCFTVSGRTGNGYGQG